MSYCVNCGVKLAKSLKKCPLCNTVVYNPNIKDESDKPIYSSEIEKIKSINFKFIAKISFIVLFVFRHVINFLSL